MRRLLPLLLLPVVFTHPAAAASWALPLAGPAAIVRSFDPGATPYGPGHRGVDLRGVTGQAVLAAGAGRVSYAGRLAGRGVVTVVHAAGLRTTYEPVTADVQVGQVVGVGQPIGRLVGGHCVSGACRPCVCLHWGLLRGPTYLDPMSLVGPTPVRLLPLEGQGLPRAAGGTAIRSRPPAPARVGAAPPASSRLVLRGADRASGLAALLFLTVGLAMLAHRPAPRPPPRTSGPAAAAPELGADGPVDLHAERVRRRTG